MICPLIQNARGLRYCPVCDPKQLRMLKSPSPRECRAKPIKDLDSLKPAAKRLGISPEHIFHYAHALKKWQRAGYPTRMASQVAILVGICGRCEYLKDGKCLRCGCHINHSEFAIFNKAKMATEECYLWIMELLAMVDPSSEADLHEQQLPPQPELDMIHTVQVE